MNQHKTTNRKNMAFAGVSYLLLADDGQFPNNFRFPVIIYKAVFTSLFRSNAAYIEKIFKKHHWENAWRDGIYTYNHYHSTTHEVLAAYRGKASVLLGGPKGVQLEFVKGDVLVLPAGVAHKCVKCSTNFKCVGAYPDGRDYDMNYGKKSERPKTDRNIRKVPVPDFDPVFGSRGPLIIQWLNK